MDPIAFQRVIAEFIDEDHRFRASPPAEVAGLIRVVEGHPGWVEPEIRTRFIEVRDSVLGVPGRLEDEDLGAARARLQEPLAVQPRWNLDLVRGSRAHAVEEVRQAQDPEAAWFRVQVLHGVDAATTASRARGTEVGDEFVRLLGERGLATTDGELGIRFEQVPAGRLPGVEQQERIPVPLTSEVPVSRGLGR